MIASIGCPLTTRPPRHGPVSENINARLRPTTVVLAGPCSSTKLSASGLPGYESVSLLGILAPAKTAPSVINRLNHEIVLVLGKPDVKEKFFAVGSETVGMSPEQFGATIKSEIAKWTKVIRSANIPVQ